MRLKVSILGTGEWGMAIAALVCRNVAQNSETFSSNVTMWGNENCGNKVLKNVQFESSLPNAVKDADVLIFTTTSNLFNICNDLRTKIKPDAIAILTLNEIFFVDQLDKFYLNSEKVNAILGIEVAVLTGANSPSDILNNRLCETTLGIRQLPKYSTLLRTLFSTSNFIVNVVDDPSTVALCDVLSPIVAYAAGISDALGFGANTKAGIVRLGLMEIIEFIKVFRPELQLCTCLESCGFGILLVKCYGQSRTTSYNCTATNAGPVFELPRKICDILTNHNKVQEFPLFLAVKQICEGEIDQSQFIDCLRY